MILLNLLYKSNEDRTVSDYSISEVMQVFKYSMIFLNKHKSKDRSNCLRNSIVYDLQNISYPLPNLIRFWNIFANLKTMFGIAYQT